MRVGRNFCSSYHSGLRSLAVQTTPLHTAVPMRRCGSFSCPTWPPTWRGRWDAFTHWAVTTAWPFCRRWAWVLVVAALIGVGFWLPTTTKFKSILAWIRNLNAIYSAMAFISIQAVLTVLFLPGALFVLMAGYTLDFWLGTLVAWSGSVLGAVGAFLLGRMGALQASKGRFSFALTQFFISHPFLYISPFSHLQPMRHKIKSPFGPDPKILFSYFEDNSVFQLGVLPISPLSHLVLTTFASAYPRPTYDLACIICHLMPAIPNRSVGRKSQTMGSGLSVLPFRHEGH